MTRDKQRKIVVAYLEEGDKEVVTHFLIQDWILTVSDLQFADGFDKLPSDVQGLILKADMPIKGQIPLSHQDQHPTYVS